jgi:hypothetical protein
MNPKDVHRSAPQGWKEVLSWEHSRVVQRDWTVGWERRCFQIEGSRERLSLVGKRIQVRELRDGGIQLLHAGRKLRWRELRVRPTQAQPVPPPPRPRVPKPPSAEHPWRRFGRGTGGPYWRQARATGPARQKAAARARGASGRPSLRSGLPASPSARAVKGTHTHANPSTKIQKTKHHKRGHFHLGQKGDISKEF